MKKTTSPWGKEKIHKDMVYTGITVILAFLHARNNKPMQGSDTIIDTAVMTMY
jgi:hypothetical protein